MMASERTAHCSSLMVRTAALLVAVLACILVAMPTSAWAYYDDSATVENVYHVDKRPKLIGIEMTVPDDYIITTETLDASIFDFNAIFKHDYAEALMPDDVSISPTSIPEGTKGDVALTITYTRDDITVSEEVIIAADVPVKTMPARDLGVGAKVKFGKDSSIPWIVIDKNHSGNPGNSITLMSPNYGKRPMETSNYTAVGDWWGNCEMRSWLNSDSGFLSGWSAKEKQALLTASVRTQTGTALNKTSSEKVYLLALKELCIENRPTDNVTAAYSFFNNGDRRLSLFGKELQWTRTGVDGDFYGLMGKEYYSYHNIGRKTSQWFSPVINISLDTPIRVKLDASGFYTAYLD